MKVYLYPTMAEWFDYLASRPDLDEVNFWRPGGIQPFRSLEPGDLFLFRTKAPTIAIGGFGIYSHFSIAPLSAAWEAFGAKNGAPTYRRFLELIAAHKQLSASPELAAETPVGCIMLSDPVFWPREQWLPVPSDYPLNNPQGAGYDAASPTGQRLIAAVQSSMHAVSSAQVSERLRVPVEFRRSLTRRRLGQGTFAMKVNDVYETRCVVSGERTRPVLEAAHIRPVEHGGVHSVDNGLLLRIDIHKLFDKGYVTVTPDGRFLVSNSLREDWKNGRIYYDLHGRPIRDPVRPDYKPAREFLEWHNDTMFRT